VKIFQRARSRPGVPGGNRNGFLLVGGSLVGLVLLLAFLGPWIAPQDPLQENYIGQAGNRYIPPPFQPGRVDGFPLGSDEFGRDILSRLLWGVRPTLLLVVVVAALRISIGIVLGLLAGWTVGRFSRWLDLLISAFLSIPVLFIALCVVAALAKKWDVWAFILGLSVTGWAESARLVQTQARGIKGQPFIEASRSMGANDGQVVVSHVLSHIFPVLLVQIAFEISAALLALSALGFLGYFINAVYLPVGDFYGIRASRSPELGQMLGTSLRSLPWLSASAGTLVFLIVLAFNFLGEGLRIEMSPEGLRKKRARAERMGQTGTFLGDSAYLVVSEWRRSLTSGGILAALFLLVFGGGWMLSEMQAGQIPANKIRVPGEHIWAAERRDAQASYWAADKGPRQPVIHWRYVHTQGWVGGPSIDAQGNLFLTGYGKVLISLDASGNERWRSDLPAEAVGAPALNRDGRVIVATVEGQLVAFNRSGKQLWVYESDPPDQGLTSPVVGKDGLIYYAVRNFLVAVTSNGKRYWQIGLPTFSFVNPIPKVSPNGTYLFFEDTVIEADTGRRIRMQQTNPYDRFVSGADGLMYLYDETGFKNWEITAEGDRLVPKTRLDFRNLNLSFRFAVDAGVAPSQHVWMLFGAGSEYPRVVWSNPGGQSVEIIDLPYRPWRLVGFDADGVVYACGVIQARGLECRAVDPDSNNVYWRLALKEGQHPVGGALANRVLYVTLKEGALIAIGE
jgi:peptide/nickel transport system permease protein